MDLLEGIYTRRSVRKFTAEDVSKEAVSEVVRAGTWAPSGMNNQPWRFVIVRTPEMRRTLAGYTKYGMVIEGAPVAIAVFIETSEMYNATKDHQAIGACLQNMLLAAHAQGLGAVWLGEILNRAAEVRVALGVGESLELMAVLAIGHPEAGKHHSKRRPVEEVLLKEI